ncbi:MAG: TIGR02186 family protein [Pseudomonadota bacterium]
MSRCLSRSIARWGMALNLCLRACLVFTLLLAPQAKAQEPGPHEPFYLDVSRDSVRLRLLQLKEDRQMVIFGAIEAPQQHLWIEITGENHDVNIRRARAVKNLWIAYDEVHLPGIPSFYLRADGMAGDDSGPGSAAQDQVILPLPWENALRLQIERTQDNPQWVDPFVDALLEEKNATGLYAVHPQAVSFIGNRLFRYDVTLPPSIRPGVYTVNAWTTDEDDRITHFARRTFTISHAGLGQWLWGIAHNDEILYALGLVFISLFLAWIGAQLSHVSNRR